MNFDSSNNKPPCPDAAPRRIGSGAAPKGICAEVRFALECCREMVLHNSRRRIVLPLLSLMIAAIGLTSVAWVSAANHTTINSTARHNAPIPTTSCCHDQCGCCVECVTQTIYVPCWYTVYRTVNDTRYRQETRYRKETYYRNKYEQVPQELSYTINIRQQREDEYVTMRKETYQVSVEQPYMVTVPVQKEKQFTTCLLYTSPSPRDKRQSRMPSSA